MKINKFNSINSINSINKIRQSFSMENIFDHSLFNGREPVMIPANFIIRVCVLLKQLDELDVVGYDDEL